MKNWELEQYLRTVQRDYDCGNDKMSSFHRNNTGTVDDYVFMSHYYIISLAIKYIEELEAKVGELSYAQKIIDEVKKNEKICQQRLY